MEATGIFMYSIACAKRIQEEGIGKWQIKGDFRVDTLENPPWPPFFKKGRNAIML
jgi:hypothetical protein